jgi:hypothetical protein
MRGVGRRTRKIKRSGVDSGAYSGRIRDARGVGRRIGDIKGARRRTVGRQGGQVKNKATVNGLGCHKRPAKERGVKEN